jgi:hypothetical protein
MELEMIIGKSYDIVELRQDLTHLSMGKQYVSDQKLGGSDVSVIYQDDYNDWSYSHECNLKRVGKLTLKSIKNVTSK